MRVLFALFLVAVVAPGAYGQQWGSASGRISTHEEDHADRISAQGGGYPIPYASVVVAGTGFGTAANRNGVYVLRLPAGIHVLHYSSVGFETTHRRVEVFPDSTTIVDVRLAPALIEMEGIIVEEAAVRPDVGVYTMQLAEVRNVPSPFKGFQAMGVLPGVVTNNELSNQYSVHGGGFNENLIFVNGFEVYMPFRPRQGEQEGLGLLNPELAGSITLHANGFPPRYGGKLSSALETWYDQPEDEGMKGSVSLSLLDAGLANRGSVAGGRLGWNAGLRKARAHHFFGTQELKGVYRPDYTDLQGLVTYRFAEGHELQVLGLYANHAFRLAPQSRKTYFGIVATDTGIPSDLRSFWIEYSGQEDDGYRTRFAGLRLANRWSTFLRMEHDLASFDTIERERFDIRGTAILFQVDPGTGNPGTGSGHFRTGHATQTEFADNRVSVHTWTGRGRYQLDLQGHEVEGGWMIRDLAFSDRIDEHTILDGKDTQGEPVRLIVGRIVDQASLNAIQTGFYLQDRVTWRSFTMTAGARADWFSFNGEWTWAPRISGRYDVNERLTLGGSWGCYYQTPAYLELRGKPEPGETILGILNRDMRSQRSIQYVLGGTYFLRARRLYLRGETFYKDLNRLVSYDIRNVRIQYSGENDSKGRAFGLDFQVYGELVPGLESRVNYSWLRTTERFLPAHRTEHTTGSIPRPADQRHTFSMFIQDHVPGDPTWNLHLRGLFGSGLPYTPPIPDQQVGSFVSQVPGKRNSARYPQYRRIDFGVTKLIRTRGRLRLELTGELLNLFDMTNTVAYIWVPNRAGIWERIPTRLTPRTFNLRVRLEY